MKKLFISASLLFLSLASFSQDSLFCLKQDTLVELKVSFPYEFELHNETSFENGIRFYRSGLCSYTTYIFSEIEPLGIEETEIPLKLSEGVYIINRRITVISK